MGEVVMISEEMTVDAEVGMEVEDMKTKNDGSSEVVRWEKLLPSMALRVLLVEADDSTRQIIAALLRKCNYRVAAVPDGLTAWETLKGRPHSIDLILTEVELPSISGYALLTLVMEHDICKNIPVIMMSSNDSISMVLKCMLKGAADFLIKPIRRNELRNLWQHVWRRQTLTSGHSHQNFHKVEGTSENDAASNHSSDCATSTQKNKESSGEGSDTQSSCTSPYLEAESVDMQNMQGLSKLNYKSTSNQSNRGGSKYEGYLELDVKSVTPESKIREGSVRLEPEGMPCTGTHYPTALRLREDHNCPKSPFQDASVRPDSHMAYSNISHDHSNVVEPSNGAIDLIGTFDNGPTETHGNSSLNEKFEFSTQLEISLQRFCSSSSKYQGVDERHSLNHSNASAFSRYNNKTLQSFCPMSTTNSTEFIEVSKSPELSSNQKSQNICGISERHGGQEAMTSLAIGQSGKTELVYPRPQHGRIPMLRVRHDNTSFGHVFSPIYHSQSDTTSAWSPKLASLREQSSIPTRTSVHSNPEIYESENNYRHSDEAANTSISQNEHQQENTEMVDEPTLGSPTAGGHSTSSSFCNGNVNHYNGIAYGSFGGTSDGNAKSVAAAERTMVTESLNDSGSYGFRGMDPHRSIQREAALAKFRSKRKDRCYEKKVRYQSRKRLAEQRPRVKGQFVRQVQNDVPLADANA